MKTFRTSKLLWLVLIPVLLLGLPLLGAALAGKPLSRYTEFPPLTRYVEHAGFSWIAFSCMAVASFLVILPFDWRARCCRRRTAAAFPPARAFPWWGYAGIALNLAAWIVAWVPLPALRLMRFFSFTPLWCGYILTVNAWTCRRTGRCPMRERPGGFLLLFPASAVFWWFFEYLNRFVQNWYYVGTDDVTALRYALSATLSFSTVLPAVYSTYRLLRSFPGVGAGLDDFARVSLPMPRMAAAVILLLSGFGLTGIAVWPDVLFPLLWVSPLVTTAALLTLAGRSTLFSSVREGRWRRIYLFAMAALICGVFWETWNAFSMPKWIYGVPYVDRFHVFEMPYLGFFGYLPFGLECAVIIDLLRDLNIWRRSRADQDGAAEPERFIHTPSP